METNPTINNVTINTCEYSELVRESAILALLKGVVFDGFYFKRYSYNNSVELELEPRHIMYAMKILFPDEYTRIVEIRKEEFDASEDDEAAKA